MLLIDSLIKEGWLKTPLVIEAFREIKRIDFLPPELKNLAEANEALPIGQGQTISQPLVVAFMLELLEPQPGQKILDVGAGSGWTSALLAYMVSGGELKSKIKNDPTGSQKRLQKSKKEGKVIALEIVPELKEFGQTNVSKYNFIKKGVVEFFCGDGSKGYQKEAPYDKILASASAQELAPDWRKQLKIGGRVVAPLGNSIWVFIKKSETEFEEIEYPGFVFVPLINK